MYKNLNLSHNFRNIKPPRRGQEIVSYGEWVDGQFYGLCYYEVEDEDITARAFAYLPPQLREAYLLRYLVITYPHIPPHTDSHTYSCINFYIDTADARTTFWKNPKNIEGYQVSNQVDGRTYHSENLTAVDSFVARSGESWALDIKSIHSVDCQSEGRRTAFTLTSMEVKFDELISYF